MRWFLTGWLVLGLGACSGDGDDDKSSSPGDDDDDDDDDTTGETDELEGDLEVDPARLDFGAVSNGEAEQQTVTLSNVGNGILEISDASIIGDGFELIGVASLPWQIPPGSDLSVAVEFSPTQLENEGAFLITSDDPDQPTATVVLSGAGVVGTIDLDPALHELSLAMGCTATVDTVMTNTGKTTLLVSDLRPTPNMEVVSTPLLPFSVEPGASVDLTFSFQADETEGTQTGSVEILSDIGSTLVEVEAEVGELGRVEESFTVGTPLVDVMVMVDQSCSMEDDNFDDVTGAFPAFVDALDAGADWQLGMFNATDGCMWGGVADTNTPYVRDLMVAGAFPGIGPFDPNYFLTESLLELSAIALAKTGPGSCNEDLLRPGANLHVIVLSDEAEQSGQTGEFWVSELEPYVSAPGELVVSGVVDINRNCGDGTGATGYEQAITATDGLAFNICNSNWGANFADAADLFGPSGLVELANDAAEGTLEVTVEGAMTTNFTYDPASGTVAVLDAVESGDEIVVSFEPLGSCD